MHNKTGDFNPKNIRYTLGVMEHTVVNMSYAPKDHHGLKNKDPVVVIHKDDFKLIIDELPDSPLKLNLGKIFQNLEQ